MGLEPIDTNKRVNVYLSPEAQADGDDLCIRYHAGNLSHLIRFLIVWAKAHEDTVYAGEKERVA